MRMLRPGFFSNEDLVSLPPLTRLFFAGLWCAADREGRLADRPGRLRLTILPNDQISGEEMLAQLAEKRFVVRYEAAGRKYLWIPGFREHQRRSIHPNEQESEIPPCAEDAECDGGREHQGSTKVAPRRARSSRSSWSSGSSSDPPSPPAGGNGVPNPELQNPPRPPSCVLAVPIPKALDTPAFREKWLEYLQYRIDSEKPYKPQSAKSALARLARWGAVRATAALEYSMGAGWMVIAEENRGKGHDPAPGKTTDEITAEMLRRRREAQAERERLKGPRSGGKPADGPP